MLKLKLQYFGHLMHTDVRPCSGFSPVSPLRHAVSPSKLCPLRGPDHRSLGLVVGISQVPICLAHQTSSSVLSHWFKNSLGFPGGSEGKASACNVGDMGLIPGLGRNPWRRERLPIPVFWPGEFHGLYSPWGREESDMTE